jgi:transcriptional regulator of acetoin/glycerol metabolism
MTTLRETAQAPIAEQLNDWWAKDQDCKHLRQALNAERDQLVADAFGADMDISRIARLSGIARSTVYAILGRRP